MSTDRQLKAAVFDLDGTLIDSMQIWREIDEAFFAKRNRSVPENYQMEIAHLGFRACAAFTRERYLPDESEETMLAEWREMCLEKYRAKDSAKYLKEGAAAFVRALHERGIRLCIATASSPELFLPVLSAGGIREYFECWTTVDEAGRDKGCPDIYRLCAEKMCLAPAECVVFDDNLAAIRAAKEAGMRTVGVYDPASDSQRDSIRREAWMYLETFRDEKFFSLWEE